MRRRILSGLLLISLVTAVCILLLLSQVLPASAARRTLEGLKNEAAVIAAKLPSEDEREAFLKNSALLSRLTYMDPDGTVRFDSWEDAATLPNHLERQEVQEAMQQGSASARRMSDTLGESTIYYALRLQDGHVLRLAAPVRVTRILWQDVLPWLLVGIGVTLILSAVVARGITRRFTRSIEAVDLDRPEEARTYEELSPMLGRIHRQNLRAQEQLQALSDRQQEMDTLLDGMKEGLVVLDDKKRVRAINRSAAGMLYTTPGDAMGKSLKELYRRPELQPFLLTLHQQGVATSVLPMEGRSYQFSATRVGEGQAVVLLLRDVTEQVAGETVRKRFTANVSHELRTPLTAICGYSEMLQSGMVQKEDQQEIFRSIATESKRLLTLVEDILELSRLDEGYPGGEKVRVNLFEVARDTVQSLQPAAAQKEVTLTFGGEPADVLGDPTLLRELVSNLVDNAIKYNRPGGKVQVKVKRSRDTVDLVVEDNGIGIEHAQQDRIFERFYRTDKSRSKQTGGTGLGLSIVKHSAEYHKAILQLHSQPGQGTTMQVSFPHMETNV